MNKKILGIAVAFLALAMLASPVAAIGPSNANDVGNNKNLVNFGDALGNTRGEAGGSIYWMWVDDGHWVKWQFKDASQTKGVMNTAFIPDTTGVDTPAKISALFTSLTADEFDNVWIYLSGDGPSYQNQIASPFGTHGLLYWFIFGINRLNGASLTEATTKAADIVSDYPAGEFWMHIDIAAPPS